MSRWANKYVIGLTGNIAVGKSVVRQMLQHLGAYTIDADGLTHQATAPGAPAYKPVVEMFGKFILDSQGRINRPLLGSIVFTYPDALARLEAIVHPVVNQAINTLVGRANQQIVVIEAIKLLEGDLADAVDTVWVVDASPQVQLQRLTDPKRRRMSPEEAQKRIEAQNAQADKISRADIVINNNGSVDDTWKQVQTSWQVVQAKARGDVAPPAIPPVPAVPSVPATPPAAAPTVPPPVPAPPTTPPAAAATTDEDAAARDTGDINVRRGMPGNAEQIASFITSHSDQSVDRMDIMMAFGQKSYLLAQNSGDQVQALIGWQVENLITRVDEFYMDANAPIEQVVNALVTAIEAASKELQSEVGFILLPAQTAQQTVQSFVRNGYELTTLEQIRIPAWREAVDELVSGGEQILTKKLRQDRVMKPI